MIARVIIDRSSSDIDKLYDYLIPNELPVQVGSRLIVPFGTSFITAFCLEIVETSEFLDKLKPVKEVVDDFVCISEEMIKLMFYMRERFFLKYIDILRLFIPSALRTGKVQDLKRFYITLNDQLSYEEILHKLTKNSEKQKQVVDVLKEEGKYLSELAFEYGSGVINTLLKKEVVIKKAKQIIRTPLKDIVGNEKSVVLTKAQENALSTIFSTKKDAILLHGVTGSGKTMVYMQAIKKVLAEGKTAIMLVPEIALTPQMLNNFRGIFGNKVAMLHSGLNDGERFDEWKKLLYGDARIVVGARSAIFAPCQNVGLIVVDEEHDSSYVSETNPRYRVVEIARFRAKFNNCKVVLGSATPSIESFKKANEGEYELVEMPNRITNNAMPEIEIVNMKEEVLRGNRSIFSRRLKELLAETIKKKEQAMLFINRLGFSSFVRCRECGYVPKCTHCDVSLTYHKNENKLVCHYCGAKYEMIDKCPDCHSHELQFGKIGTEKVVEELKRIFPDVKALKLDSSDKVQRLSHVEILRDFAENKAQVLVGTQMIAKGHDFSNVTLVGLLDADLGLYQQDFRSNERTFQLVTQMAGRAGRADKKGLVVLQTYSPNNYVYKFAVNYDYDNFFKHELNVRETTNFPPFVSIIRVLVSSELQTKSRDLARVLYLRLLELKNVDTSIQSLAGMESPISKIKNSYRYQIVMRINKENELDTLKKIYGIIDMNKLAKTTVFVEQDPQSLM